ncbi:hypothetical protein HAX54_040067, partial [Datura stramonium]|nr:hypothetical protein [Datura stramonium]
VRWIHSELEYKPSGLASKGRHADGFCESPIRSFGTNTDMYTDRSIDGPLTRIRGPPVDGR